MMDLTYILCSSDKVYPMSESLYKFAEERFQKVFEFCRIHEASIFYISVHSQMKVVSDDERIFSKMENRVISEVNIYVLIFSKF